MRLARIRRDDQIGIGVQANGAIRAIIGDPSLPDLDTIVQGGEQSIRLAYEYCLDNGVELFEDKIAYLPPLSRSQKILCVGLNYREHADETGFEAPEFPTVFARFPSGLVGHNSPLIKPTVSDQFDFEGEMAIVIARSGRDIEVHDALGHVGAYSVFNDGSIRDFQLKTTQWTVGKNFDSSGAFGPWLVTPDELPCGGTGLQIVTRLNGETVQSASTSDMIFDVATLVSLLSSCMTLIAGDIIVTGTPAGVGMTRTPPLYMRDGDICEVEIESIGRLQNTIIDDPRHTAVTH